MNENKRLLAVFGVTALVVFIIVVISFWPKPDKAFICDVKADSDYQKLGKVNYEQYKCLVDSDDKNALVIADSLSDKEKSNLNTVAEEIGRVIYYLDVDAFAKSDIDVVKKELKYSDNSFAKDVILVIDDEEVSLYHEGSLSDYDKVIAFTKEAELTKFACGVKSVEEYENLGEIDYEQYNCLYEKGDPFVVVVAQTTCSYCISYKPVINDYAIENNVPVYVMEIDRWSENEMNSFTASLEYFNDNQNWGTPLTLGIENKEVVAEIGGYTDSEESLNEFFDKVDLK